jgi:hypothetical protein
MPPGSSGCGDENKSTMATQAIDEQRKYKFLFEHVAQREKKIIEFLDNREKNAKFSKRYYEVQAMKKQ